MHQVQGGCVSPRKAGVLSSDPGEGKGKNNRNERRGEERKGKEREVDGVEVRKHMLKS